MGPDADNPGKVKLVPLGPTGTCHERAAVDSMAFQGIDDFEFEFIHDVFDGLERIPGKENAFLIQCSTLHLPNEGFGGDEPPRSRAPQDARHGGLYRPLCLAEVIDVQSKSIVAIELLAGGYDTGLTHLEHFMPHPEDLRLVEEIGAIDTTWLVYGTRKRFQDEVVRIPSPELFSRLLPAVA